MFEIPDQKTVLQATLKSEFSKNFFCTLISIENTLKKISLTKSIEKSGHTLGDPLIVIFNRYYSFVSFIGTVRENDKENNYSKPYLG